MANPRNNYENSNVADFLFMLSDEPGLEHIEEQVLISLEMEGEGYLKKMLEEFQTIEHRNDWGYFVELAKDWGIAGLDKSALLFIKTAVEAVLKETE